MELRKLNSIFDHDLNLTENLARLVEDSDPGKSLRASIDDFIKKHMAANPKEAMCLEANVNELIVQFSLAYLTAGFSIAKCCIVYNPEVLKEVEIVNKVVDDAFGFKIRRNGNGLRQSGKTRSEAISRQ